MNYINRLTIEIVSATHLFAAGYVFKQQIEWAKGFREILMAYLLMFSTLFFASVIFALWVLFLILGALYHRVYNGLHLGFMLRYMIFKQPLEFDELRYKIIKAKADKMRPKWYQFGDKIFVYCVRWALTEKEKKFQ